MNFKFNDRGNAQFPCNRFNRFRRSLSGPAMILLLVLIAPSLVFGQRRFQTRGEILSVQGDSVTVRNPETGRTDEFQVQNKDSEASSSADTKIRISGPLPKKFLEKGMVIRFQIPIDKNGKSKTPIESLKILSSDDALKIEFETEPAGKESAPADITAKIVSISRNRLRLSVPDSPHARSGKLNFELGKKASVEIADGTLDMLIAGDSVSKLEATFKDRKRFVLEMDVKLTGDREKGPSFDDQLEKKFGELSDEPGEQRVVRSQNFVLQTDISEKSAAILLAKLERMHGLIAGYYGKQPRKPINCYVVRPENLSAWSDRIDERFARKIRERAGVTSSIGRFSTPTVYSCDNHGVVQHEAVHAFCGLAFGSTGPIWYGEGMAEMGQYWRDGQLEVKISRGVVQYLTQAEPKKLKDIVAAGQVTGDSWEAYAWRWALCHLLASNPNYAKRFKRLGIALMSGRKDSFDNAYGPVAPQISFEYDQFIENFGNGYRVDLCIWDWNSKSRKLSKKAKAKVDVKAQSGWQATRVQVKQGTSYEFSAEGEWNIDALTETTADGNQNGVGRLVGVVYHNFQLSKPFDLGVDGSFEAPIDGDLFVRCKDSWTDLGNNDGSIKVVFKKAAGSATSTSKSD